MTVEMRSDNEDGGDSLTGSSSGRHSMSFKNPSVCSKGCFTLAMRGNLK